MQRHSDQLLYAPSDLGNFVACEHLTQLDLAAASGESARPNVSNAYVDLIKRKGEVFLKRFAPKGMRLLIRPQRGSRLCRHRRKNRGGHALWREIHLCAANWPARSP
jgi:hypothetical protein